MKSLIFYSIFENSRNVYIYKQVNILLILVYYLIQLMNKNFVVFIIDIFLQIFSYQYQRILLKIVVLKLTVLILLITIFVKTLIIFTDLKKPFSTSISILLFSIKFALFKQCKLANILLYKQVGFCVTMFYFK